MFTHALLILWLSIHNDSAEKYSSLELAGLPFSLHSEGILLKRSLSSSLRSHDLISSLRIEG